MVNNAGAEHNIIMRMKVKVLTKENPRPVSLPSSSKHEMTKVRPVS